MDKSLSFQKLLSILLCPNLFRTAIARIEEQTQLRRSEIYPTEILKISGVVLAAIVIIPIVFVSAMNSQDKSPSRLPSLASNQIESSATKTNAKNLDGWIFIGQIKNPSSSSVKKPLISASRSINSPAIPLKGNKVTVIKRVSMRQNRPQKPNFNYENIPLLGAIEKGKKVIIVDTFVVPSTSNLTTVWAKVRKCDVACK
jgi:hypothetical protein